MKEKCMVLLVYDLLLLGYDNTGCGLVVNEELFEELSAYNEEAYLEHMDAIKLISEIESFTDEKGTLLIKATMELNPEMVAPMSRMLFTLVDGIHTKEFFESFKNGEAQTIADYASDFVEYMWSMEEPEKSFQGQRIYKHLKQ